MFILKTNQNMMCVSPRTEKKKAIQFKGKQFIENFTSEQKKRKETEDSTAPSLSNGSDLKAA
jgi:hypothetical protein